MESGAKVQKAILYQNTCSLCPKSDLKHCVGECTCSWLFVCMFSKERLCLPFLDFLCPVLDARCQLPAHMHSLQTEPVSVFITSRHWTVKNRKCFSSSSHLHTLSHTQTHSHSHYLCHSLTLSASSCLSLLLSCGLPHPLWVPKKA